MKEALKKLLKNKFYLLFFLTLVMTCLSLFVYTTRKEKIGLIVLSDIHAGSQKERIDSLDPNNIIHPANFEKNLTSVLNKTSPKEIIIVLGDSLNQKSEKYAIKLKNIMREREIIWVKGNHDKEEIFKKFFNKNTYYSIEKDRWKIIILDNGGYIDKPEENFNKRGRMGEDQISWLKEQLQTKKRVLIAMHVPLFDERNPHNIREDQKFIHEIFKKNKNVKYVLAGHFHTTYLENKIDGIKYIIVPSVSKKGQEGFFVRLKI